MTTNTTHRETQRTQLTREEKCRNAKDEGGEEDEEEEEEETNHSTEREICRHQEKESRES
jgi:hypothetical protein